MDTPIERFDALTKEVRDLTDRLQDISRELNTFKKYIKVSHHIPHISIDIYEGIRLIDIHPFSCFKNLTETEIRTKLRLQTK